VPSQPSESESGKTVTAPAPLTCPSCRTEIPFELSPPGFNHICPACLQPVEGLIFPAFHRPPNRGASAEAVVTAEDAGCFYHPESRAQQACEVCGRFLCHLCDVVLSGRHVCPACVNAGTKSPRIPNLDGSRILYGGIAVMIALIPLLIAWPVTFITGPLAVFVAIYGWNKPQSLTGTRRLGYLLAIGLGLAQTLGWGLAFAKLFHIL